MKFVAIFLIGFLWVCVSVIVDTEAYDRPPKDVNELTPEEQVKFKKVTNFRGLDNMALEDQIKFLEYRKNNLWYFTTGPPNDDDYGYYVPPPAAESHPTQLQPSYNVNYGQPVFPAGPPTKKPFPTAPPSSFNPNKPPSPSPYAYATNYVPQNTKPNSYPARIKRHLKENDAAMDDYETDTKDDYQKQNVHPK